MAEYLGTVYLGGLYNNGAIMARPSKPWRSDSPFGNGGTGDIPSMSGSMANYVIGNTPTSEAQKLKWHKIKDGSKTLLICDRNILANVSWDDLNAQNLVSGKTFTIDGQQYKARLLTGGSNYRNSSDAYAGGSPATNEWDRFITREEIITGLPAPVSSDLDSNIDETDRVSTHNQFWNWGYCYSWAQEAYAPNTSNRSIRGYGSARCYRYGTSSVRSPNFGWRPVLEVLNTAPLISDSDRDLGDKNSDFSISYTVNDTDATDALTVTESLDGTVTKTISNAVRNQAYTINVAVNNLSIGTHTITINVNDGKGGTATRVFTFRRTNAAPIISGSNANLGDKNVGFQVKYTVNDSDGDSLTVTEKLGTEILRTINNAPKGQELTIDITSQKLYTLGLNSVNTITIEVNDGKGGVAYRSYTFKRTNTAPTISGVDENVGVVTGAFSKNYTVSDAEGDIVVVTEKIDDEIIRSYSAQLGTQQTITLPENVWHRLTNEAHSLKVEAVDGNFATSIRIFAFTKDEKEIKFELSKPFDTDAKASKVLVTPTWKIEGAIVKVEACNNAYDDVPTWEDITAQVIINRVYNFVNATKTATKWGVNIRFSITKNEGYTGEVNISGFGGAFE
ncbi:hypothetical protein NE686_13290 [Tissierella carlieri]|uniref:Uncharacterized protein n=1 Tax=Tissierella carlieri TaxID=689904 RepID=A0ABT1SC67_9FIRM|nr:hypothetical protein [Tissierella carlieri]MCQ4924070.1 hypothetical protein [Tissierella carlieri]